MELLSGDPDRGGEVETPGEASPWLLGSRTANLERQN